MTDLVIWEIRQARQGWRYGIRTGPAPALGEWADFEMLNESFNEYWLMVNVAVPVQPVGVLPADADYDARWDALAKLEGWITFTCAEQTERLRLIDEADEEEFRRLNEAEGR